MEQKTHAQENHALNLAGAFVVGLTLLSIGCSQKTETKPAPPTVEAKGAIAPDGQSAIAPAATSKESIVSE